jgi:hypothetical protein
MPTAKSAMRSGRRAIARYRIMEPPPTRTGP